MFKKKLLCIFTAAVWMVCLCSGVLAAEVDCDSTYCFSAEDFSSTERIIFSYYIRFPSILQPFSEIMNTL